MYTSIMDRKELLALRLEGLTYKAIADKVGLSRQRIQQLLSPPTEIRNIVVARAEGKCQECGILVGDSGHVHHNGDEVDAYNDIANLELLCLSCHRRKHSNNLILDEDGQVIGSERDTVIIPIRVKKTLVEQIKQGVTKSKKPSRNAWLIWAIEQGLRSHRKDGK